MILDNKNLTFKNGVYTCKASDLGIKKIPITLFVKMDDGIRLCRIKLPNNLNDLSVIHYNGINESNVKVELINDMDQNITTSGDTMI